MHLTCLYKMREGDDQSAGEILTFSAKRTSSAADEHLVFSMTQPRWTLMVFSVVPNVYAICLLSLPVMTQRKTSFSRGVNVLIQERYILF
jgi:hypothetical protein